MNEWQPIETAPENKVVIVTDGTITAPAITRDGQRWDFWEGEVHEDEIGTPLGLLNYWVQGYGPTHWAPLASPEQNGTGT